MGFEWSRDDASIADGFLRIAHEQIAKLAGNLSSLNTIYGNMLGAMQGRQ